MVFFAVVAALFFKRPISAKEKLILEISLCVTVHSWSADVCNIVNKMNKAC